MSTIQSIILKSKNRAKKRFSFTLLEIVLCIAILGIIAAALGWQIRNMVVNYSFDKSVGIFVTDLKQMQFLALANQIDIEITIYKSDTDQKYYYKIVCNDPNKIIKQPFRVLDHVEKILLKEKNSTRIEQIKSQKIIIFHNGRTNPEKIFVFSSKNNSEKNISIDLIEKMINKKI